jgi:hypothetical protein
VWHISGLGLPTCTGTAVCFTLDCGCGFYVRYRPGRIPSGDWSWAVYFGSLCWLCGLVIGGLEVLLCNLCVLCEFGPLIG